MIKLICPECQHENEAERIYCHDCGARLDRTVVSSRVSSKEKLKETQRHVRSLFDARRLKVRLLIVRTCKLLLGAFLLAAGAQMVLPPDVPPAVEGAAPISQITLELEDVLAHRGPAQLQYTQDQANEHLRYVLKNKQSKLNKPFLEFKRALVEFDEGRCDITVQRALFGYSFYTASSYAVRPAESKLDISNTGGRIGRLPVHPALMQYLDILFGDLWSALDRERRSIAKMGAIEFHDKAVLLSAPEPLR